VVAERLQEELDALAIRLGRSLTIDSVDGELIAYSTQRDDTDTARVSAILLRRVPVEIGDWQARYIGLDSAAPVRVPANPDLGMSARICVPLRWKDKTLGYLWMLDTGAALTEPERHAACALAGLLEEAPGRDVDRRLRRLLEDGQGDVPALRGSAVPVIAAVPFASTGQARPFRSKELSLVTSAAPAFVGSYASAGYAILVPRQPTNLEQIDQIIGKCLAKGSVFTLGISDPMPLDARSAPGARYQALVAAELAGLDPALDRHSYWSALGAYRHLLDTDVADAILEPLAESSKAMLLTTLETFLDLAGDIQAVAARLNLHRSSLYYRLDRISRLLGVDLSSGLTRLHLHVAVKGRRASRRTLTRSRRA
jgi:hypothetical protein